MTNQNLQKLETAIRGALPELMELSEGCELSIPKLSEYKSKIIGRGYNEDEFYILYKLGIGDFNIMNLSKKYLLSSCTIIGRPVTILHLLRWLDILIDNQFSLGTNGLLQDHREAIIYFLDLSKPLLSQQSQEVIDNLVKLVK